MYLSIPKKKKRNITKWEVTIGCVIRPTRPNIDWITKTSLHVNVLIIIIGWQYANY